MSFREIIGSLIVVSAAAVPGFCHEARADEAYLCGPDKIIYVKAEELEFKKRTDACVAAYYGLTVERDAQATAGTGAAKFSGPEQSPTADLKKSVVSETGERRGQQQLSRQASLLPPSASPGTDYRNVRIINASSADTAWFYHAR
jgi:hypothetical protein